MTAPKQPRTRKLNRRKADPLDVRTTSHGERILVDRVEFEALRQIRDDAEITRTRMSRLEAIVAELRAVNAEQLARVTALELRRSTLESQLALLEQSRDRLARKS